MQHVFNRLLACFLLILLLSGCSPVPGAEDEKAQSSRPCEPEAEDTDLAHPLSCRNETGEALLVLRVAPADSEDWSEDLLQNGPLLPHTAVQLAFIPDPSQPMDLMVRDRAGRTLYFSGLRLYPGQMLTLSLTESPNKQEHPK